MSYVKTVMRKRNKFKVYELADYLDSIQDLTFDQMRTAVAEKLQKLKQGIREAQYGGSQNKLKDTFRFYKDLRELHYFLTHKEFSETLSPNLLTRFRWIIEKLVKRGELDKSVLVYFEE